MQITHSHTSTMPPSPTHTQAKTLRQADVWLQYAPGGPWPQLQLQLQLHIPLEQMSPISPAQILSSHTHSLISTMTLAQSRQTEPYWCRILHADNVHCSCKAARVGNERLTCSRRGASHLHNAILSAHRCTVYTHCQHVNIVPHPQINTCNENGGKKTSRPPQCFTSQSFMLLPNKQMLSFIRHLQQPFYSPFTINITSACNAPQ